MTLLELCPLQRLGINLLIGSVPGLACQGSTSPTETNAATTAVSTLPGTSTTGPAIPTSTLGDDGPTPTSGDSTTSMSSDSSSGGSMDMTAASPMCGNGILDGDEECDDGADGNGDTRFCKENCTLNVCGDGKLFVGWELCDEGAANSGDYGSLCGADCKPGARCGDHILQPGFESCDLGLDNDGPNGDDQGILCDASCQAQQLRGFVTNDAFSGDLGGLFGADLKCQAAAMAAGLAEPGRFHAYLSTGKVDAKQRFEKVAASLPYVFVTGKKFAANFASLAEAGPLGDGLAVTETGVTLYKRNVATNTAPGGLSFSPDQDCQGWTSADAAHWGRVGLNAIPMNAPDAGTWKVELWWTGINSWHCDKALFRLYCLEI